MTQIDDTTKSLGHNAHTKLDFPSIKLVCQRVPGMIRNYDPALPLDNFVKHIRQRH